MPNLQAETSLHLLGIRYQRIRCLVFDDAYLLEHPRGDDEVDFQALLDAIARLKLESVDAFVRQFVEGMALEGEAT